jgi:hypothetical protein
MKIYTSLRILIFLLGFLAIGAIFGGGVLIISPNGELLRMPISNLGISPFKDFLIPGIILFIVLGIIPGVLILALLRKPECRLCEKVNFFKDMHWAWTFCIYVAFALIIWIQVEMIFLQTVFWVHTFYIGYSIVMIFVTLLPQVRNLYTKEDIV